MISGILLAAGESSRMGKENKLLLPVDGAPMFKKSLVALEDSEVDEIIVVLGHDYKDMMPYFNNCTIKLAINGNHLEGQTSSIQSGLKLVNPSSRAIIICLADMPLLTSGHVNDFVRAFEKIDSDQVIMKPFNGQIPGNPVIFSRYFYQAFLDCMDADGCKSVIKEHVVHLHKFETADQAYFTDVDTPEEYKAIL